MPNPDDVEPSNCEELQEAIGQYQAGGQYDPNEERYLIDKSVELGCTKDIPDDFGMR